jgi:hypothetical protein
MTKNPFKGEDWIELNEYFNIIPVCQDSVNMKYAYLYDYLTEQLDVLYLIETKRVENLKEEQIKKAQEVCAACRLFIKAFISNQSKSDNHIVSLQDNKDVIRVLNSVKVIKSDWTFLDYFIILFPSMFSLSPYPY